MGYTRNVVEGFSWHSVLKALSAGVVLVKLYFLARLLSPTEFGLFSLVAIALGITEAVTETGINITILQSKQSVSYYLNTAWVIAILRGLVIGIVMLILGSLMGDYYQEPGLPILVAVAALVPVIKGFINPAIVQMLKGLKFFNDSVYRFSLVVVEAFLAVVIASQINSALALVLSMIGAAIFEVVISFVFFSDRPRFALVNNRAKEIINNAKGLTLSAALSYFYQNLDDVVTGKVLGTYGLGLYHNSYALGHKTNYEVAKATHHGTLPVFTKISQDIARLKRGFWRSVTITMLIAIVVSLPLLVAPGFFVELILGNQWLEIIPSVPLMTVAGIISSFSLLCYGLFIANKEYQFMNTHLFATVVLMVFLLIYLGKEWGLVGAAWALVISRLLTIPILVQGIRKSFNE